MRILIGATCVAVIAFVAYFFVGEYHKASDRAALTDRAKMAAIQKRGVELDLSGECTKIITEIVALSSKTAKLTLDDIPYMQREDAAACTTVPNDGFVNHQTERLNLREVLADYLG